MRYVTIDDYMRICPEGDATQQNLESAEYDIDSLTFNRIIGQGFDRLAERQKELVTRAVCLQADFCANMASCSAIRSPLMRSTGYPCRGINPCWYSRMASVPAQHLCALAAIGAHLPWAGLGVTRLKWPQLVPSQACCTPITVQLQTGLNLDGTPKQETIFEGKCNYSERSRQVMNAERSSSSLMPAR